MNRFYCNKNIFLWLFLTAIALISHAQEPQSIEEVRQSGKYYFGQASSDNESNARINALQMMVESITVEIKSEFTQIVEENNNEIESYTRSVVNTFSSAILNGYTTWQLKSEPGNYEMLVFISKDKAKEAFKERADKILDFLVTAEKAERENRIGDALRYNYWALLMAHSHPDNRKMVYDFGDGRQINLLVGVRDRLESIMGKIKFDVSHVEKKKDSKFVNFDLQITYQDKPVQRLDFLYADGRGFSNPISAAEGMGYVTLPTFFVNDMKHLKVKLEYKYEHIAKSDPDIEPIISKLTFLPDLQSAYKNIPVKIEPDSPNQFQLNERITMSPGNMAVDEPSMVQFAEIVTSVVDGVISNNSNDIQPLFTSEGWDVFTKLIKNGNVTVLENQQKPFRVVKVGNETMVRSVPMLFAFNNNREKFVEQVVFNFDSTGKINGLAYALSDVAIRDITSRPDAFGSEEQKFFLIKFMEDFKTAYALKRHDYLQAIFDENALIIVGRQVKRSNEPVEKVKGMYAGFSNDKIEYLQLSKAEYMDRLEQVFRRNEFINIRFEENTVTKTQKDNRIYGIQIEQHYYSSTYADKGYLFLMIDMNDSVNPRIYVRSWQPEKNPDGSIYGLHDFRF